MALFQALLHAFGHVGRNKAPDLIHVLASKSILPERRLDNIVIEPKESLRRLLHTGVFARETSDKDGIVAAGVELGVDGALRENGHLVRVESVRDGVGAVLERELGDQAAFDRDVDLGAAGMGVRGVEAAGTEEADGHADTGADEGWEDLTVRAHRVASFAACHRALRRVVEIVDKVGVVSDEIDAIFRGGCELEGLDQVLVVGDAAGPFDVWQGGGVIQERGWKRKSNDAELSTDDESGEQHNGK